MNRKAEITKYNASIGPVKSCQVREERTSYDGPERNDEQR